MKRNLEPQYDAAISLIRHMSNESLKDLINNDEKVNEIITACQQCKDLETEKHVIIAENKSIAKYNLSLSPILEKGKTKLKELCDSVQTIRASVEEKQSNLNNHSGNLSRDTVLALLQAAAAESEEESEKIAEKFYQNEMQMEEFLDQFQTFRKLMHLRRVKVDKMCDILSKNRKANDSSNKLATPGVPYPTRVPYPIGGPSFPTASVPYPLSGMNLPSFPMT